MRTVPRYGPWTRTSSSATILTLAEMKAICNIDSTMTDDDVLLVSMEKACRNICEKHLGRPLLLATNSFYFDYCSIYLVMAQIADYGIIKLPGGALSAIGSIVRYLSDNTAETVDATTYETSLIGDQAAVYFKETPFPANGSSYRHLNSLSINVTGGFGAAAANVPDEIKQGMLFNISYWYEHRGDEAVQEMSYIPPAAKALWSTYRMERFK